MVKRLRQQSGCCRSKILFLWLAAMAVAPLISMIWGHSQWLPGFASEPGIHESMHSEASAAVEASQERQLAANNSFLCNIFTLWEYPKQPPLFNQLAVETWRRHSHGLCNEPILINDFNVRIYIPDMPEEYFSMPYPAAKSDLIRYALIYHHGGMYMDADFIVVKDLSPVTQLINRHDLVAYADDINGEDSHCDQSFSANFIAGRRGSSFHKSVWEKQKTAITRHCPLADKTKETVCCFDNGDECHIPWAQIGEGVSHAVIQELGESLQSFCFAGDKSFVPKGFLFVLEHLNKEKSNGENRMLKEGKDPLGRIMYHTFNAIMTWKTYSCSKLGDRSTVLGELFSRSFEHGLGKQSSHKGASTDLFLKFHPEFTAFSRYPIGKVPCKVSRVHAAPVGDGLPLPVPSPDAGATLQQTSMPTTRPTSVHVPVELATQDPLMPPTQPLAILPTTSPVVAPPSMPSPSPPSASTRCKIFTLWEYPKSAPLYARLNVETWRRHSNNQCGEPILVSSKNVMNWIPDMPQEFFKFPYHAATSDLIRYALLYHHGGIYMDADFIVMKDMKPIFDRLGDHDLISYSTVSNPRDVCSDSFSSNFIASRKGSIFMKHMWEKQKALITNHCPLSDKPKEKVCCFDDPHVECHIPFAGIGEGASHPMLNDLLRKQVPLTTYCFGNEESFVPDHFAYVLEHVPDVKKAIKYLEDRRIKRGLDRLAFHMFNSIIPFKTFSCKKLFSPKTTVGHLYTTSFSTGQGKSPLPMSDEANAFLQEHPDFMETSKNHKGGWPCKDAWQAFSQKSQSATESGTPATSIAPEAEDKKGRMIANETCKIFAYWEYEGLAPLAARLNVESWRRHSRHVCGEPVLITLENVKSHVPDVPEEFFRLPYVHARADFIKWGAIYNNGGLWIETDILITQSLAPVWSKVLEHDLVSFQDDGDGTCTDQFNPSLIGAPKGSPYFKAVWESHKGKLVNHCPLKDKDKEIICCFDEKKEKCHIPWLSMNRGLAHPLIRDWGRKKQQLDSYCFVNHDSFQVKQLEHVLKNNPKLEVGLEHWKREGIKKPLERIAYHFQQGSMKTQQFDCNKLFDTTSVLGAIYLRSFTTGAGASPAVDDSPATQKFYEEHKVMKTVRHVFDRGLPCQTFGPPSLPSIPANFSKEVCNIFTLWDYPKEPPLFKMLNVESWRRHTHGLCREPVLINDKNVKEWIPDMPPEYFRMPAKAAKSDLIRYALLYHHGGLYMDADFVVVQDLDPIVAVLDYDFVSYTEKGEAGQTCSGDFSSNLVGGRKGSVIHKTIWEKQKAVMKRRCGKLARWDSPACCYDNGRMCNVPWAALGEGVSHPVYKDLLREGDMYRTFCFADEFSFVPDHFAYSVEHIPGKDAAVKYMEGKGIRKSLDRITYHLFNAITGLQRLNCGALFDTRRLIGHLYAESFFSERGRLPVLRSEESDAFVAAHPEFARFAEVYNGWQPCRVPPDVPTKSLTTPQPALEPSAAASEPAPCSMFTLWEYQHGPPMSVGLNVEGWRRHSHGRCGEPVLINDANVKQYIPDMPDEYFRMPYSAAKSDIIRYALIYHHGGMYMDTDFLVVQDLDSVIDLSSSYDLVSYTEESTKTLVTGGCSKDFSSNFMAGRKGSVFMKTVWERQKKLMTIHCPLADKTKEKVCCFNEIHEKCHIPWAGIGEGVSHPVFDEMELDGSGMKSYCFSDDKGFILPDMINILEKVKSAKKAADQWAKMNKLGSQSPWDRIMYHTFNSIMPWSRYRCKDHFDNNTVYGRLNVLSYTTGHGKTPVKETSASREFHNKHKVPTTHTKTYPNGWPCPTGLV